MSNEFDKWKNRVKAGRYYSPVIKKYMVIKNGRPLVMNVTYQEATLIKKRQVKRTEHKESAPVFDIVFIWEE